MNRSANADNPMAALLRVWLARSRGRTGCGRVALCVVVGWLCGVGMGAWAAETEATFDRTEAAVAGAVESIKDTGRAAAVELEGLWQTIDENRLKNRTWDEVVAWVIMGVLVGATAGMFTSLKSTGSGRAGRLLLGLAGAFLGGMVVHVTRFDLGLGPVLIRYEELLFSFLGAVLLILVVRLLRARSSKRRA
jgi:uncharacterized membrane protein YeaQ/YmgE (transglycosylase-associated protein family)